MPTTVSVAVMGAGQAALAVSRLLTGSGIDHVVLERGRVAERRRSRPWQSLRRLAPDRMTRLPGWHHTGEDQAGRPSMQPAGRDDGRAVDLRSLLDRGVTLPGRSHGVDGDRARFADDLPDTTARADARPAGLLRALRLPAGPAVGRAA